MFKLLPLCLLVTSVLSYGIDLKVEVNQDVNNRAVTTNNRQCYWSGTAPFCEPECPKGWKMERQDRCGDGACCVTSVKYLCCEEDTEANNHQALSLPPVHANPLQEEAVTTTDGRCYWSGTAPFCSPECPNGWRMVKEDKCGDGQCCATSVKYLCCEDPSVTSDGGSFPAASPKPNKTKLCPFGYFMVCKEGAKRVSETNCACIKAEAQRDAKDQHYLKQEEL